MSPPSDRLALAQQLFVEFYARCFWHSDPNLVITEDLIPFVIKGLRDHGGRSGFVRSAALKVNPESEEPTECR